MPRELRAQRSAIDALNSQLLLAAAHQRQVIAEAKLHLSQIEMDLEETRAARLSLQSRLERLEALEKCELEFKIEGLSR